jgi:hypothetical protein
MDELRAQFENWQGDGAMDAGRAKAVEESLTPASLRGFLKTDDWATSEATFADVVGLICFLNEAARVRASILEKLAEHVEEFRDALVKIAARLKATSFTIGVSVPIGVSVSLTFPPIKPM